MYVYVCILLLHTFFITGYSYYRKNCLPFSAQQLAQSVYSSAGKLLKHLSTVFSAETQTQEEMTESNYLNSEKMCAEYRDELDDFVTVTDY